MKTLIFEGGISFNGTTANPTFYSPVLETIIFKGATPTLSDNINKYFSDSRGSSITVYVSDKTEAQIETMKTSAAVWSNFKDIKPYVEGMENVSTFNQTIVRTGGVGTATFTYTKEGTATVTDIMADNVTSAAINDWASGDQYQINIQANSNETLQVLRNGQDVTNVFTRNGANYSLVVDSQTSGNLFTAIGANPWDEATWVIKITTGEVISFADDAVKAICVQYWDTDGDGELSYEEAAAVTSLTDKNLNRMFNSRSDVTSFDELQYFTGLKYIHTSFYNCTSLQSAVVPESITNLMSSFKGCTSLKSVVLKGAISSMQEPFYGCSALETVTFEGNTTLIGSTSFFNCTSLKTIDLPESLTKISYRAFH